MEKKIEEESSDTSNFDRLDSKDGIKIEDQSR